jgi:5'-methylthioadenosine phosphorylase
MQRAEIGIIGGSGLYEMEGLREIKEVSVRTPYGSPSDAFVLGTLEGRRVAFLSRHARGHRLLPTEINYRANLYGFKLLGVERILSVGAVGSMKEAVHPGHLLVPDQFYDHTKSRVGTFFGNGLVAHVSLADPVCPELRRLLVDSSRAVGATVHDGGVYLCIEGPQFSSRGESLVYRRWGVDVIGMTNATEAKLAREAEICYATLALATDFDCWYEGEKEVTGEAVLEVLQRNVGLAKKVVRKAILSLPATRGCGCGAALKDALITPLTLVPSATRKRLNPLLSKYHPSKGRKSSG